MDACTRTPHPSTCKRLPPALEDRALIEGTLAGRQEDFEVLVERYQKMLYAFAFRYLQDADAADEVVQATFVQAYTHLSGFRGDSSFKTWLHQVALNQCRALHRARQLRRSVAIDDVPEGDLPHVEGGAVGSGWRATLGKLVGRLPPRQRAVLTLRVFSDLAFKEIARMEGITENSAKVSYHHAVTRLKQWLTCETF